GGGHGRARKAGGRSGGRRSRPGVSGVGIAGGGRVNDRRRGRNSASRGGQGSAGVGDGDPWPREIGMRFERGGKKKLTVAFHFLSGNQAGWKCESCRRQGLEGTRRCGWIPEEQRGPRKVVWAR